MPLSEEHLRQLRELLGHRDAKIQAQGRELLVSLAHEPDALRGCRLAGAHLSQISLAGRDLRDTDLTAAWLEHADLSGTDLRGAILDDARLAHARLSDADLSGASMRGATLDEAPPGTLHDSIEPGFEFGENRNRFGLAYPKQFFRAETFFPGSTFNGIEFTDIF